MSKVLIADDEVDICEFVAFKLECLGHDVKLEHDGERALATALAWKPDVILLDRMMPQLSGLEVCAALRKHDGLAGVAVIMLTAMAQESDIQLGLAAGVDDYILKPFSPRELGSRIELLLAASPQSV